MIINRGKVIENSAASLLSRVTGIDGDPIVQADVDSITVVSYESSDTNGETPIATSSPDVADVIHDSLVVDGRWTADAEGYNFALDLDGSFWPHGDTSYRIEAKVTPTDGSPFYVLWLLQAESVYGV